ncbi:hypothetical protein K1719_027625 [Acacia pycnantha]|nr:hypothetical protein K1719_027625 [Acacia pycnantha]
MGSPLPPKPTPLSPVPSPNTPVQYDHRPVQRTHRPSDICFRCRQAGHWSRNCPLNNKSSLHLAQNSNVPKIYCRCGHGYCEVRTAKNNRNFNRSYYACPIKRGKKCRDFFVKWCDDIDESDLCPPPYAYPMCSCRAGVCRRVKATSGPYKGRYCFVCPIRQGHGACSYCVWEESLPFISNFEDLLDTDITPNFGDIQDMDMDVDFAPNIDDPRDTDIPDTDDSQDIADPISMSWESLIENAQSILHELKSSAAQDLSPENPIQHHEEEKVSLANIADNYLKLEDSYGMAKAEFEASQKRSESLREEASQLKIMQQKLENEIISCELQTKEIETRLREIEASMMGG